MAGEASGTRAEIRAKLTGPGGPFEVADEPVLGEQLPVIRSRPRSLRDVLEASAAHEDKEYLVQGDRRITYGEHRRLVASAARHLAERHGIGTGACQRTSDS